MKFVAFIVVFLGFSTIVNARNTPLQRVEREDLYSHFFNINSEDNCKGSISCSMLRRHLIRDSKNCLMDPTDTEVVSNYVSTSAARPSEISGSISYLGVAPGKYAYDIYLDSEGKLNVETSIYFKNINEFSARQIESLKTKMKRASDVWTNNNRFSANPVKFHLLLAKSRSEAKIVAKLKRKFTRGPYFSRWSLSWSASTIAHEMGHMLGLDDEYSNNPFGGSMAKCSYNSVMCNSNSGRPQDYQYYLIFRRMLCQ